MLEATLQPALFHQVSPWEFTQQSVAWNQLVPQVSWWAEGHTTPVKQLSQSGWLQ